MSKKKSIYGQVAAILFAICLSSLSIRNALANELTPPTKIDIRAVPVNLPDNVDFTIGTAKNYYEDTIEENGQTVHTYVSSSSTGNFYYTLRSETSFFCPGTIQLEAVNMYWGDWEMENWEQHPSIIPFYYADWRNPDGKFRCNYRGKNFRFKISPRPTVESVLTPYDVNRKDHFRLGTFEHQNGNDAKPEIVVAVNGDALDILAQDYAPEAPNAVLLHLENDNNGFHVTQALTDLPMLHRIMGLTVDNLGNRYYATTIMEDLDADELPVDQPRRFRSNIVRVIKVDPHGSVLFNTDLDIARGEYSQQARPLANMMAGGTARLQYGKDVLFLIHSTQALSEGKGHQMEMQSRIQADTGRVTSYATVQCSHCFDQRLLFDGDYFVEYYLGDAYPRAISIGRKWKRHILFDIKGSIGDNDVFTELGDIAVIENDPTFGYIGLFSTEYNTDAAYPINDSRNLAITRIDRTTNEVDQSLEEHSFQSRAFERLKHTNRLRWLTTYENDSNSHAIRPKLIPAGNDKYIVLWEKWKSGERRQNQNVDYWYYYDGNFQGVYGMLIDDTGDILVGETLITNAHHLQPADDAVAYQGKALWVTGDEVEKELRVHMVDKDLNYTMDVIH